MGSTLWRRIHYPVRRCNVLRYAALSRPEFFPITAEPRTSRCPPARLSKSHWSSSKRRVPPALSTHASRYICICTSQGARSIRCSRDRASRPHSCALSRRERGFYRSAQRVNNDARVLCDLWRIKQMLREGRKRRRVFATSPDARWILSSARNRYSRYLCLLNSFGNLAISFPSSFGIISHFCLCTEKQSYNS